MTGEIPRKNIGDWTNSKPVEMPFPSVTSKVPRQVVDINRDPVNIQAIQNIRRFLGI